MGKANLDALAGALGGLAGHQPGPTGLPATVALTKEERSAILGGKTPSLEEVAYRLKRGLYHNLQQYNLPTPESIFDISYFKENPQPFYTLAKELYPGSFKPTLTHAFVTLLEQKSLLLRSYTQNIDCLDRLAGISPGKLVEAHGSFATAHYTACSADHPSEDVRESVMRGEVPRCKCGGAVKPQITFFGESLPSRFGKRYVGDMEDCDLCIVMGTSLRVTPFSNLPNMVSESTPRVLINREEVGHFAFQDEDNYRDVFVEGDTDDGVRQFARLLGWEK